MTTLETPERPGWVQDGDELPHPPPDVPLWCENYLSYGFDHERGLAVWWHLCFTPGSPGLWEEILMVSLPDDEFLVAKGHAVGHVDGGVEVAGLRVGLRDAFGTWETVFRGAARRVSGTELRAGPLADGPVVALDLRLEGARLGPTYDFGEQHLDNEWAAGHYECHQTVTGSIAFGDERHELSGTGLRDHSWGARDYRLIGPTTWIHGRFPDSGRNVMIVKVVAPGRPEPFVHAVVTDGGRASIVQATEVPSASTVADTAQPYALQLHTDTGVSTLSAEILQTMPMSFIGAGQIGIGCHTAPDTNHDYIEGLTRFDWDGEIGHGISERSVAREQEETA